MSNVVDLDSVRKKKVEAEKDRRRNILIESLNRSGINRMIQAEKADE